MKTPSAPAPIQSRFTGAARWNIEISGTEAIRGSSATQEGRITVLGWKIRMTKQMPDD
jgi:hypothetical protein